VPACGDALSGEPDVGKSACPVRRGESGSYSRIAFSPTLPRSVLIAPARPGYGLALIAEQIEHSVLAMFYSVSISPH
jgi:hypothetical protein